MTVNTDHISPCGVPGRGHDSLCGVTTHPGCEMAADLREVGCNSTALPSGRTQPTDREDHRREPWGCVQISYRLTAFGGQTAVVLMSVEGGVSYIVDARGYLQGILHTQGFVVSPVNWYGKQKLHT